MTTVRRNSFDSPTFPLTTSSSSTAPSSSHALWWTSRKTKDPPADDLVSRAPLSVPRSSFTHPGPRPHPSPTFPRPPRPTRFRREVDSSPPFPTSLPPAPESDLPEVEGQGRPGPRARQAWNGSRLMSRRTRAPSRLREWRLNKTFTRAMMDGQGWMLGLTQQPKETAVAPLISLISFKLFIWRNNYAFLWIKVWPSYTLTGIRHFPLWKHLSW